MVRRFFLVAGLIGMSCGLSSCGTIEGAGKDIERAGQSIQRTF